MNETEETLEIEAETPLDRRGAILKAIENLSLRFDALENRFDKLENKFDTSKKESDIQFEAIREGIAHNSARFDQLEAIALEAKSIALITRSQLTILTEEMRRMKSVV